MATTSICAGCTRALRASIRLQHEAFTRQTSISTGPRCLSTWTPARTPTRQCYPSPARTTRFLRFASSKVKTSAPKTPSSAGPLKSAADQLAQTSGRHLPQVAASYSAYGSTQGLFRECSAQADYTVPQALEDGAIPETATGEHLGQGTGWWYDELKLTPTFNTWAQVTFLHMYLLTVRIRLFPEEFAPAWHQQLIDHFSYAAEEKMATLHQMSMRGVRNKYLKDLYLQWRGVIAAYDEGILKNDAVLATAVWRNIFKADQNTDMLSLAQVVAYMRRELSRLDAASDAQITDGSWKFDSPASVKQDVLLESKSMKQQ